MQQSAPLLRDFKVHHATSEALLLQLPDEGFGRMTKQTLGNDAMAEKMLRHFATRTTVHATPRRIRDPQGYLTMGLSLPEVWSGVRALPPAVSQLLCSLFRKHELAPLGYVQGARVVKTSPKGTIFSVASGITAVAPLEHNPQTGSGAAVDVRVLNYDANAGALTVTSDPDVVSRAPATDADVVEAAKGFAVGSRVSGRVLLAEDETGNAVVELRNGHGGASVLGYYLPRKTATGSVTPFVYHSDVEGTVEHIPNSLDLASLCPFVILTDRASFDAVPLPRCVQPVTRMHGPFPWRDAVGGDGKEDDEARERHDGGDRPLRRRRMEEAIDAFERDESAVPKSPDEFQKLLLATPNSSYLWTQYMAFHVGLQQYEEARLVAEKALRTLGVRESKERMNVWVAYMNLENAHGTAESLTSVFRRALQNSREEQVLHEKLADIFKASKKTQQLLALCRVMTSKFRNQPRVWERLGSTLIETGKRDQLKRVVKDMGEALKKQEQCIVVEHLAIFEYRNGSVASGRALFEGLVAKVPKQSDVWSAFLDQELGLLVRKSPEASVTFVRDLFDRVTSVTLFPAKVMQQLLTRYLSFEQAHGSPHGVERVKEKARLYVESRIASVGGEQ